MKYNARHVGASLIWIGGFKLLKGLLLVVAASGVIALINDDLQTTVGDWAKATHFAADNRHFAALLEKVGLMDDRQLKRLGVLTFCYGAIFMTEGTGLIFKRRWAEYLTLGVTLSFVPMEGWEIWEHCTAFKVALLVVNLVIVGYLVAALKRKSARAG